jgi:hypothetical protein
MSALSDADYVVLVLQNQQQDRASEISSKLESGELELRKKSTLIDRLGTGFFILLTVAFVGFLVVFLAGVAKNLLQMVW